MPPTTPPRRWRSPNRIALLRAGRIIQVGTPLEVYCAPVDPWAARLTGPASEIEAIDLGPAGRLRLVDVAGVRSQVQLEMEGGEPAPAPASGPIRLLVRPDWARLGGPLPGRVVAVRFRGSHTDVELATPAGPLELRRPGPPSVSLADEPGWTLERARRI